MARQRQREWNSIELRKSNVKYVSRMTGETEAYLRELLDSKAKEGIYAVQIPLDTRLYLRREG